jgi:hypothetical protein
MFCALRDCVLAMERTKHNSSPQVLKDSFDKEICGYLNEQVEEFMVNCELFQGFPSPPFSFFLSDNQEKVIPYLHMYNTHFTPPPPQNYLFLNIYLKLGCPPHFCEHSRLLLPDTISNLSLSSSCLIFRHLIQLLFSRASYFLNHTLKSLFFTTYSLFISKHISKST